MSDFAAAISIIIVCVIVPGLILKRNMLVKLLNLNIFNTATVLFFLLVVYCPVDRAPIVFSPGVQFADPLPQALMLTSIVINFGVLPLYLLLSIVLVKRYHTPDLNKIKAMVKREFRGGQS